MSFWTDAVRMFRDIALVQDKADRAMTIADEARRLSIENDKRIGQIETAMNYMMRDIDAQRRLPPPH